NKVRDAGQYSISEDGQRIAGKVSAVAELFERNAGEKQYRGAADFVETIDMVDIFAGVVADTLLSFGDEIVTFAELRGASRACLGAGSRESGSHTIGAHRALLHTGKDFVPLVLGDAEGTGHHAIAAAHATVLVVNHWTSCGLAQGTDRAHRSTGRIGAVHA